MSYPEYVDGKPPTITLKQYDSAPWAGSTCVDRNSEGNYVVVDMQDPSKVVAGVDEQDRDTLNQIFSSAHADYAKQIHEDKVQKK